MADALGSLRVTVAYSPGPRQVLQWEVTLEPGATVRDALARCGLFEAFAALGAQTSLPLAVWGRAVQPTQALRDQDRVEVLRPLLVDPKVARRERFVKQGMRAAGLFARKPGKR
ncbi:MAG: hypothetical protein RI884_1361 [Pseudomonadota bacterium]|jgi:sulfur carrier protein